MERGPEFHEVDINKADSALKFVADYIQHNSLSVGKAEVANKEVLMGLILTGVHTGIFQNDSPAITEVRNKIFMAFDIGYVFGRLERKE